jgi:hypothetical protein
MGIGKKFAKTFDEFSTLRKPAWEDFGHYAPPVLRPGEFMGYVGGRAAADYVSDATRNYIWRLNALQAQTTDTGRYLGRKMGLSKRDSMLAGVALTNVVEMSSGNIDFRNLKEAGRPKGYKSIFPQTTTTIDNPSGEVIIEKDWTKSQNPIAEIGARYFLGRTGGVLPYDQFKLERPDVTPEEFSRYMAKYRDRTFFGLENADRTKTTLAGAAIGGAVSALTKKPIHAVGGLVTGVSAPNLANISSELGVMTGTRESLDDPVGELRIFGYRLPIAKVAGAVALAAGVGVGGKKLMDSGLLDDTFVKKWRKTKPEGNLTSQDPADLEKVAPPTEEELRKIAQRLGREYPPQGGQP